jgi:prophage tail gpP-like protein
MTAPSGRVTLSVEGASFRQWSRVDIVRDLREISGSFTLDFVDEGRAAQALPSLIAIPPFFRIVRPGMACSLAIDGEAVLTGWIDDVDVGWTDRRLTARIQGRDKTGDLVDCSPLPNGPAEFRNVDLLYIARQVCLPFGITARADVDVGLPFDRLGAYPYETGLAFLEKAARQRAVLLVSDGLGGLLLTRGGSSHGPAALTVPGNVQAAEYRASWRRRFSDVYVKGQTDAYGRRHGQAPAMTPASTPGTAAAGDSATEASTVVMTGHAIDPEITRYRPIVKMTRTQSGMSTVQEQADWWVRIARGLGEVPTYTVLDWRAGPPDKATGLGALWRPNQVVPVTDPYADIDKKMLIASVRYSESAQGLVTQLRLGGVTAFDRIKEAVPRRRRAALGAHRSPDAGWSPLRGGGRP